jgi:hypothetical protein
MGPHNDGEHWNMRVQQACSAAHAVDATTPQGPPCGSIEIVCR